MNYVPIVGLEIHLQVKTKTKMFSRVSAEYFQAEPNTHVDQVDFGLSGALPIPNKVAFEKAIKFALALNCKINQVTKFDRKNYYYPDLPKGYQISQYDKPIGYDGYVEIEVGDDSRRIRIRRVHIEEDTGKSIHTESGTTLIDYNKSGIPLIEIVTEPDFESIEEVLLFAKRLRQLARYTDTSDAEMQKGQMRFELNISLKEPTAKQLPNYQIEVKNIGSISVLEKVLDFEAKRQSELLEKGETIKKQTRGLKDMTGETVFQRYKENADDYRYFPEPDIPPITISNEWLEKLKAEIPELPGQRKQRYLGMGLSVEQADSFVEDIERGNYFDEVLNVKRTTQNVQLLANWVNSEIAGQLVKRKKEFSECPVGPSDLVYLLQMMEEKKILASGAKKVIEVIFDKGGQAEALVSELNLIQVQDDSEIDGFVDQAIKDNPHLVADLSKNPNVIKALIGQVMKLSKGRVNPQIAEEKLKEKLG